MIRRGLRALSVDVVDCRAPLWSLPGHSRGPAPRGRGLRRVVYEIGEVLRTVTRTTLVASRLATGRRPVDAIVVAEFNHGLAPVAFCASRLRGIPLVVDFLLSFWETGVIDRRALGPRRPRARYRWLLDSTALRLADIVLTETPATARRFEALFGGDVCRKARDRASRCRRVCFHTVTGSPSRRPRNGSLLRYMDPSLHGVEHILGGASLDRRSEDRSHSRRPRPDT